MAKPATTEWNDRKIWESSGFLRFLTDHDIDASDLLSSTTKRDLLRYIRLKQVNNSGKVEDDRLQLIAADLARKATRKVSAEFEPKGCPWLPGFYSLPVSAPLASVDLYKKGEVYGIDISSGYAVKLLNLEPGEHVLDLCCAPGAKLAMVADLLHLCGSVTGVDCSRSRLGACKQLVHKYGLVESQSESEQWRCRLFHADGSTFSIGPKTECMHLDGVELLFDTNEIASRSSKSRMRKRKNKSARSRDAKRQKVLEHDSTLYDKVLVDAECTHDGSIRHLQRLNSTSRWNEYVRDHLNLSEIERILKLQRALIRNGFSLLRSGGLLIYSTCSLSFKQNEEIVSELLQDEPLALLDPIVAGNDVPCREGKLPGTLRFIPSQNTSGLFIARIRKINQ
ncbi:tRNA cytosine-5-methylases and related enzymes of the NOL1/NOP2/sun superfamily [Plasmopara halstedii]|uniref:tRNA cytosine-5-methylases and related enzymes of the NOL1/NOP2/sun superfamily n=1 Tax=Plasmopara halstedii TaxID=4781 RepID=A0A0P1B4B4_PLAHL|nr:tRNA cytosine-5-methylases and related enzymes of the NOL1/NOP2/sun superfamily [Plasmopara halstedii]CEG49202.1 tRNA cytosine-5-methylases and related enzymes of the NOL1/NOP2/sun superfamily [Plasmopara halstedii]|eukprot:XP_024585571.1 tRNA cytosine-5-methylases and related enzymes of the NOL1/NOP2/sun superfamily [Plasmopara halstedii]